MPLDEGDLKLMWDMLDAARRVVSHVGGYSETQFLADRKPQDVLERCVEIVGEAARNVSEDARREAPDVPWQIIVGTRHILAHDYGTIDPSKMWRIVTIHVPALADQLVRILRETPPGSEPAKTPPET